MYETEQRYQINGSHDFLKDYLQVWLTHKRNSIRHTTWSQHEYIIRLYISPKLGNRKLIDLTPHEIQEFYLQLKESNVGDRTITRVHTTLHCSLNDALKQGIIQNNPTDLVDAPKYEPREMNILSENEISRFLISIQGHRNEALYFLAVTTGLRQSELLGLKWSDLNWQNRSLKVVRQLKRFRKENDLFNSLKTKRSKRTIQLGTQSLEKLQNHKQKQENSKTRSDWIENGLIFCTRRGTPINQRNLHRQFKSLLRNARLPNIRFHDLRHTAASIMLNNGIPILTVSRRLGHSKPSITLDVYGHIIPAMQSSMADKIDNLVSPPANKITENIRQI